VTTIVLNSTVKIRDKDNKTVVVGGCGGKDSVVAHKTAPVHAEMVVVEGVLV